MKKKIWLACCLLGLISLASVTVAFAEPIPNIDIQIGNGTEAHQVRVHCPLFC